MKQSSRCWALCCWVSLLKPKGPIAQFLWVRTSLWTAGRCHHPALFLCSHSSLDVPGAVPQETMSTTGSMRHIYVKRMSSDLRKTLITPSMPSLLLWFMFPLCTLQGLSFCIADSWKQQGFLTSAANICIHTELQETFSTIYLLLYTALFCSFFITSPPKGKWQSQPQCSCKCCKTEILNHPSPCTSSVVLQN